jgi:multidrug efflux pump subunit AcrA (membrane-fusion protein)
MALVLAIVALIAVAVAIRSSGIAWGGDARGKEPDAETPVVEPSRVVSEQGEARVTLDSAEIARIGLTTATLADAVSDAGRRLSGRVVPEPERVVTLRAPVSGRLVEAEGRRWPSLGERLAAGTHIGRVSDARPLAVPFAGVVTAIGARPGEIVDAGQVLLELADNAHPVVSIAWPDDAGQARNRLLLLPPTVASRIEAVLIGPAAEADPLTRHPAYLYRARARWPGALPGTVVAAIVPAGDRLDGLLVPDDAVVQWEGLAWVYVQRGVGSYIRVRVPTDRPAPGGWVAGPPLAAGDTVAVAGVQELLSEEFRARVTVGEESGE